jgi:glycerol-3-phosphate dehydrogenase (NAD(P)+)
MEARRVGILGAGAWGTALGKMLAEKGHDVRLWSFEKPVAEGINQDHVNQRYLPEVPLPDSLEAVTELSEAVAEAEFIIVAIPSLFILDTVKAILSLPNIMEGNTFIGVVTKGFITTDRGTRLIIETLEDYLPGFYKNSLVYISGPSHAEEVGRGRLTGLISASQNPKNAIRFRELMTVDTLKLFSSLDVVGVQVCGAMKNIIAIAFGMMDALKELTEAFGDNTESLLLAAGLNEIQTMGVAMGSTHPETFTSIAGVGDLDVTCRSQYGRNRRFGRSVVLEDALEQFTDIHHLIDSIDKIGYLPEGVVACRAAQELMQRYNLKLPITGAVYRILNKEANPFDEIRSVLRTT